MKVSDLRKYRKNVEALEAINRLLSDRVVVDSVQGSHGYPDFAPCLRKIEGLTQDRGTTSLLKAKADIQREQAAIRLFINGIKERRIYEALFHYCIDEDMPNPTWEDVADKMNEDSPQALKMAVSRHLEINFENISICY